jgi:hypothetical protein
MTHVLLLNLVFFAPATCGAATFAFFIWRFLTSASPPDAGPDGGSTVPQRVGPDDLARSA